MLSLRTPRNQIRHAIRQIWLRSRERGSAIKRDKYTCQKCLTKQSTAKGKEFKVEVHHKEGIINWDVVIDAIIEHILCHPDLLITLCKLCHKEIENETR